jgi:hypothetical protein
VPCWIRWSDQHPPPATRRKSRMLRKTPRDAKSVRSFFFFSKWHSLTSLSNCRMDIYLSIVVSSSRCSIGRPRERQGPQQTNGQSNNRIMPKRRTSSGRMICHKPRTAIGPDPVVRYTVTRLRRQRLRTLSKKNHPATCEWRYEHSTEGGRNTRTVSLAKTRPCASPCRWPFFQ